MDSYIDEAIRIAKRSPQARHQTGCLLIDKSGEVVATGWSHVPEHFRNGLYSIHAEMHALYRAYPRKAQIAVVARISRDSGNVGLAKPCVNCAVALRSVGFRTVYYTTAENYGRIDLHDLNLDDLKLYKRRAA